MIRVLECIDVVKIAAALVMLKMRLCHYVEANMFWKWTMMMRFWRRCWKMQNRFLQVVQKAMKKSDLCIWIS